MKPLEYKNFKLKVGDIVEFNEKNKYIGRDTYLITDITFYYKAFDKHGFPISVLAKNCQPIALSHITKDNNLKVFAYVTPDQIEISKAIYQSI